MEIIKFSSYNRKYLIPALRNHELFFNNISKFNDPFEGIFRFKLMNDKNKLKSFIANNFTSSRKSVQYYMDHTSELESKINEMLEYRALNNAVSCFSLIDNLNNILMWAHYANNHKGLCLVFKSDIIDFRPGQQLYEYNMAKGIGVSSPSGPFKVNYTDAYLGTDPINGNLNQATFLTTKFDDWKYEKEVRFIAPLVGSYSFNPISLKKVVFGLRTPLNYKTSIKNIIRKQYNNVLFERITLKDGHFAFETEVETFRN